MTAVIGDEQHTSDDRLFNEICLRRSQLIVPRLNDYVPLTIRNQCRADDWSATTTSGGRFSVEKSGLDLVSSTKGCLPGDRIPELQNKIQLAQRCIYANIIWSKQNDWWMAGGKAERENVFFLFLFLFLKKCEIQALISLSQTTKIGLPVAAFSFSTRKIIQIFHKFAHSLTFAPNSQRKSAIFSKWASTSLK